MCHTRRIGYITIVKMKQLKVLFFALLAIVGVACSKSNDEPKQPANYLDGKTFVHTTKQGVNDAVYTEAVLTFTAKEFTYTYEFKEEGDHRLSTAKGTYTYSAGKLVITLVSSATKDLIKGTTKPEEIDPKGVTTFVVDESKGTIQEPISQAIFTLKN